MKRRLPRVNRNWGSGSTPSRQEDLNSCNKGVVVENSPSVAGGFPKALGVAGSKVKSVEK